jgi:hypothetical protein
MPRYLGYGRKRMNPTPKTNPEKKNASDRSVKGAKSKTHPGDKDYTTKKGDKDFHRDGKDVKKKRKPFMKKKK